MLLSLAQKVDASALIHTLRDIAIIGALVNVAHLLALSVFAGALLVVDLRFMGTGLTREPLPTSPARRVRGSSRDSGRSS